MGNATAGDGLWLGRDDTGWAVTAGSWNGPSPGSRFRRLTARYERLVAVHRAFLHLGCALICWRYIARLSNAH